MGNLSTEVSWPVREASGARISTGEGRGDDSWALQPGKTFGVLQSYPLKEISSRDLSGEEIKENNR